MYSYFTDFSELSTESSKREIAEKEAQKLKRDVEELKRAEKVKKPGSKQNDIRLQRALDEVQKYKSEMAELVRKNRDQDKDFYFVSSKSIAKKALTKIIFSTTVVKIPE